MEPFKLSDVIRGEVLLPGDKGWDAAVATWCDNPNDSVKRNPAIVVRPKGTPPLSFQKDSECFFPLEMTFFIFKVIVSKTAILVGATASEASSQTITVEINLVFSLSCRHR